MTDDSGEFIATLRADLAEARARLEPASAARDDVFRKIAAALPAVAGAAAAGAPPVGGAAAGAPPVGAPPVGAPPVGALPDAISLPMKPIAQALAVKVAVSSAVSIALVGGAVTWAKWTAPAPAPEPLSTASPATEVARPPTPSSEPTSRPEAQHHETPASLPDRPPAKDPRGRPRAGEMRPAVASPSLDFDQELAQLRRAQAALRDGQARLALALIERLDAVGGTGALLAERGITRVLSLCALGREQEALRAAGALLERADGAVYRSRLATSCARELIEETAGDESTGVRTQSSGPIRKEP